MGLNMKVSKYTFSFLERKPLPKSIHIIIASPWVVRGDYDASLEPLPFPDYIFPI